MAQCDSILMVIMRDYEVCNGYHDNYGFFYYVICKKYDEKALFKLRGFSVKTFSQNCRKKKAQFY